jgi:hypothetical protein
MLTDKDSLLAKEYALLEKRSSLELIINPNKNNKD